MWVLKGAATLMAVLLALALVAGGALLISFAVTIGGALMALIVVGTFVVLGTTELYEKVTRRKRR